MQVNVEKKNGANAKATGTITNETISKKEDKIAKEIAKTIEIPGFRKGKVPPAIVKKRYKDKIAQDAKSEAVQEFFDKALSELQIEREKLIGEPVFDKFEEKEDQIEIEMSIAFRPEIDLGDYKSLIPEVKEAEVSDEEVENRIKDMLKAVAPFKKVEEDRELKEGDFALIDFEGFIDGKPFEGGKAEGYLLEIGSKSFIEGFEDQLIGMKAGETREIKVTFPENYGSKELAGKEAVFKVTLNEIQQKDIPSLDNIDEETLKKLLPGEENPSIDLLKEKVKEQIKSEKMSKLYNEELKPAFVEKLVENISFDLPENIVEQEMDLALRNAFAAMSEEERKEYQENVEKVKEKREEFREEAKKSVKLTFIVDELAKKEQIDVSDQELSSTIYFEALQTGRNPQELLEYYKNNNLLPAIKMAMIEDKLFSKLFDNKLKESKEG